SSLTGDGSVTLGNGILGNNMLTINNAAGLSFDGTISGSGGLTKQGAGIYTLNSTNTYGGATAINEGTLQLGAANAISNVVTLANGATLDLNDHNLSLSSLTGSGNVTLGNGTLTIN